MPYYSPKRAYDFLFDLNKLTEETLPCKLNCGLLLPSYRKSLFGPFKPTNYYPCFFEISIVFSWDNNFFGSLLRVSIEYISLLFDRYTLFPHKCIFETESKGREIDFFKRGLNIELVFILFFLTKFAMFVMLSKSLILLLTVPS